MPTTYHKTAKEVNIIKHIKINSSTISAMHDSLIVKHTVEYNNYVDTYELISVFILYQGLYQSTYDMVYV